MPAFAIAVDLSHLMPANSRLDASAFPALSAAVRELGDYALARWVEYAMGKPLPSGAVIRNDTGEYARSIMVRETGPFGCEVYTNLTYARGIEEGTPEHDMKKMLSSSLKVRLTKDGKRYLIIPIRHSRYTGMPDEIAEFWKGPRETSHITGTYRRQSSVGVHDIKTRQLITVPGWRYSWGDRLGKSQLKAMGITGDRAKKFSGMVKFSNPGGELGGGAKKGTHNQLITFRRMVEGSKGWIAKAQPGKWPARTVADQVRPLAEKLFEAAITEDVKGLTGQI